MVLRVTTRFLLAAMLLSVTLPALAALPPAFDTPAPPSSLSPAAISGTVRLTGEGPAAGIRVLAASALSPDVYSWSAITGADGIYSFPAPSQPPLVCGETYNVTLDPSTVPAFLTWSPLRQVTREWTGCAAVNLDFYLQGFSKPPGGQVSCSPPSLLTPCHATTTCDADLNFCWRGDCASYIVEYDSSTNPGLSTSGWTTSICWHAGRLPVSWPVGWDDVAWHVRGRDSAGRETVWSSLCTLHVTPPPLALQVDWVSCDRIRLGWNASRCGVNVTDYAISYADGTPIAGLDGTVSAYTVTGLPWQTAYSFTVSAMHKTGSIETSNVVTATTGGANTLVEAETGFLVAPMEVDTDTMASGGAFVHSRWLEQGSALIPLCVSAEGDYVVRGRVWGGDFTSDSFFASVDGGAEALWSIPEKAPRGTWTWAPITHYTIMTTAVQVYHLTTGGHTLLIRAREPLARLDVVDLVPAPTPIPLKASLPLVLRR